MRDLRKLSEKAREVLNQILTYSQVRCICLPEDIQREQGLTVPQANGYITILKRKGYIFPYYPEVIDSLVPTFAVPDPQKVHYWERAYRVLFGSNVKDLEAKAVDVFTRLRPGMLEPVNLEQSWVIWASKMQALNEILKNP